MPLKNTKKIVYHEDDRVFIERKGFYGPDLKSDSDRADMIWHEVFMRRFLTGENVNVLLKKGNIWDAVELVTDKKTKRTREELRSELAKLGFEVGKSSKNPTVKKEPDFNRTFIQLSGINTITVKEAREAKLTCHSSNQNSLFGELLSDFIVKNYPPASNLSPPKYERVNWIGREYLPFSQEAPIDQLLTHSFAYFYLSYTGIISNLFSKNSESSVTLTMSLDDNNVILPGSHQVEAGRHRLIKDIQIQSIPSIDYDIIPEDRIYDDFGSINENARLTNLSISIPLSLVASDGSIKKMKTVNVKNGIVTPIELDTNQYIDCLKSELSKRAVLVKKSPDSGIEKQEPKANAADVHKPGH